MECDQVQIIAVTNAFELGVTIETMTEKKLDTIRFPEECEYYFIHMLFRPGHYDILYET